MQCTVSLVCFLPSLQCCTLTLGSFAHQPLPPPLLPWSSLPPQQVYSVDDMQLCCLQAAEEQLKALQAQIVQRGCKEEFQPDPTLMKDGKVGPVIAYMVFC